MSNQKSIIDQMTEMMINGTRPIGDDKAESSSEDDGIEILYVTYEPKIKWFKPPLSIKIFKWEISMLWAYKVHRASLFQNCYPLSVESEKLMVPSYGNLSNLKKQ